MRTHVSRAHKRKHADGAGDKPHEECRVVTEYSEVCRYTNFSIHYFDRVIYKDG